MEQFIITGPSRSGKTTFISKYFDLSSQSIKISALTVAKHPENIEKLILKYMTNNRFVTAKNINTIIIDEFNYGVTSYQTQKLISSILNTVNTLNFKYLTGQEKTPFITTIVWSGTQTNLLKQVTNNLLYDLVDNEMPLTNLNITNVDTINENGKNDSVPEQSDPFNVYRITTTEN